MKTVCVLLFALCVAHGLPVDLLLKKKALIGAAVKYKTLATYDREGHHYSYAEDEATSSLPAESPDDDTDGDGPMTDSMSPTTTSVSPKATGDMMPLAPKATGDMMPLAPKVTGDMMPLAPKVTGDMMDMEEGEMMGDDMEGDMIDEELDGDDIDMEDGLDEEETKDEGIEVVIVQDEIPRGFRTPHPVKRKHYYKKMHKFHHF